MNKTHKKKNKKKKKGAKKAAMPALAEEDEMEDDDSDSEESSPIKTVRTVARAELAGAGAIPKRSLADRINEMNPAEREDFQKEMQTAFIAKAARTEDSAHLPCKVYNKLNGGRCTDSDGCFDSGCTNPIVTREVTQDLKIN